MLSKLKKFGQLFQNEPEEAWQFKEIVLTTAVSSALKTMDIDMYFQESSAKIVVGDNHCYIPSQYFLYAIKVRPLAMLLRQYVDVFDRLNNDISPEDLANCIKDKSCTATVMDDLDTISEENFYKFVANKESRLGAKDLINGSNSDTKVRGTKDIFGSIILKALPVPDASSSILGQLVYHLTSHPAVYESLEKEYSHHLSYLMSAESEDDVLFYLFFFLDMKDKLSTLLSGLEQKNRFVSAAAIADLFLLTSTAVAGNESYVQEPLTYFPSSKEYVFLKKGVLGTPQGPEAVNKLLQSCYPELEVKQHQQRYKLCTRSGIDDAARAGGGINKIYYGAPGTGKSFLIDKITESSTRYVTVFHSETQYSDFVGSLKPVMKTIDGKKIISYEFRSGKFTDALIEALNNPTQTIYLVIEEINRAPAASVFGEIFQLLDRQKGGKSKYTISLSDPDMDLYIREQSAVFDGNLYIPSNLSILATMNSSDQSVMPMDTAFKRRWLFEYLPIDYSQAGVGSFEIVFTDTTVWSVPWKSFAKAVNSTLSAIKIPEDRLLGHRFISDDELNDTAIANTTLRSKVLVYLWDDVLRHGKRDSIFKTNIDANIIGTFGQLAQACEEGKAIFSQDFEIKLAEGSDKKSET